MIMLEAFGSNGRHFTPRRAADRTRNFGAERCLSLSVMGATGILGRLTTGLLLDRFFAPYIAALMLGIAGPRHFHAHNRSDYSGAALTGTALMGYGLGSEADVVPYLIARYFGRKHFRRLVWPDLDSLCGGRCNGPYCGRLFL